MDMYSIMSDSFRIDGLRPTGSLSIGFSRQEYWSGLPFPPPGDLPDPGIESPPLACPSLAGGFFTTAPPGLSGERPEMPIFLGNLVVLTIPV